MTIDERAEEIARHVYGVAGGLFHNVLKADVVKALTAVRDEEREACAVIADDVAADGIDGGHQEHISLLIADTIRKRGAS